MEYEHLHQVKCEHPYFVECGHPHRDKCEHPFSVEGEYAFLAKYIHSCYVECECELSFCIEYEFLHLI